MTAPRTQAHTGAKQHQTNLAFGQGGLRASGEAVNSHKHPAPGFSAQAEFPTAFAPLFDPYRYKIYHGGRAGSKSWNFGRALLLLAARSEKKVLCAREFQTSIKDSVMALLKDQIRMLKLHSFFRSGKSYIESACGSVFLFAGLRMNAAEIKSLEGVDVCWVEEGQRVSEESWVYLIPTIRKPESEIWCSFNPYLATDPTYKRFVASPPPNSLVRKVGWRDNPWFNATMDAERKYTLSTDPDAYDWIWEGNCLSISDAVVFKGKFKIEAFETPADTEFMQGADWGFGSDPTTLVRMFIKGNKLLIDYESYALGLDLDKIAATWRAAVPACDTRPIYADNSQPQTIAHVRNFGFIISGADKWSGSVMDGINYLRSFEEVVIHERCYYTGTEFRLYSYKTDRLSNEVLPELVDKNNHCIDASRYGLQKYIRCKNIGIWEKLGARS